MLHEVDLQPQHSLETETRNADLTHSAPPLAALVLSLALILDVTYRATSGVNPFSAATWALGTGLALACVADASARVVTSRARAQRILLIGLLPPQLALAFACGVAYTFSTTLHMTDVLSSYTFELTHPALLCAALCVYLYIRLLLLTRSLKDPTHHTAQA